MPHENSQSIGMDPLELISESEKISFRESEGEIAASPEIYEFN